MFNTWLLASLHLVALGLGVSGIWGRAKSLGRLPNPAALKEVFYADNFWGLAAILWISTGLMRAFGTTDKGMAYYGHNQAFSLKMILLVVVLALEVWPMVTLIGWRIRQARGQTLDLSKAPTFALISWIELVLTLVMVLLATAMAKGFGA